MSIADPNLAAFESAVRQLVASLSAFGTGPDAEQVLTAAFNELADSELTVDEVSRRAGRIVEESANDLATQAATARAAYGTAPAVRSAVLSRLPPVLQRVAYSGAEVPTPDQPHVSAGEDGSTGADIGAEVFPSGAGDSRTVWLLGAATEIETNAQMLDSRGFQVLKIMSPERLNDAGAESCCGVAIHKSWWSNFDTTQSIVDFLNERLTHENLPWYRIDADGLGAAASSVTGLLDRFDPTVQTRVQVSSGCDLTEFDLKRFSRVAALLDSAKESSVRLDGLTAAERQLIAASVAMFEAEKRGDVATSAGDVALMPITDGRSSARVFRCQVTRSTSVFIAKIARPDDLQAEFERAKLVSRQADDVEMRLYAARGVSVLVQKLVPTLDAPEIGAPSLRDRLKTRTAWERGRPNLDEPLLDDLERGIERLVAAVNTMNVGSDAAPSSQAWMAVEPLTSLQNLGVAWSIDLDDGDFDPADGLPAVLELLEARSSEALIHGDLHAGNVLMMDDRTPRLIDFAAAGSGHPNFDLVRVSSALAYMFIRPVVNESTFRHFFRRIHADGASVSDLKSEFPSILSETGTQLATSALVRAREAIFGRGGKDPTREYLAMVYLIAVQSLTMDEFQAAVVRPALGAVFASLQAAK